MDLYEFKATVVYRASSSTAKATQRNPVFKNKKVICILVRSKKPDGQGGLEDVEGLDRFGQITGSVRALEFLTETMVHP